MQTSPNPWSDVQTPFSSSSKSLVVGQPAQSDLLLLVFIHGFKGDDGTFAGFPERLAHVLQETMPNLKVESIVFPAYETKGDLSAAVDHFSDWLTTLTVEKEVAHGAGSGAGKAGIVLCGHSMGGLLAVDSLISMVDSRVDKDAPLWPRIVGCIAYDTPYFGLHPHVFKNGATKAAGYVQTARDIANSFSGLRGVGGSATPPIPTAGKAPLSITAPPSGDPSGWSRWAPAAIGVGGALLAGAAAGATYWRKDDIGAGYKWWADHMKYVGNLWDEQSLSARVSRAIQIERDMGVLFRTFYTHIPPKPPTYTSPRTFVVLPTDRSLLNHFIPAKNGLAEDEVQAHVSMFEAKGNDGYYELGLASAQLVREAVNIGRGLMGKQEKAALMDDAAADKLADKMAANEQSIPSNASGPTNHSESENLIDL